jgi:endoglycosylceramidase
MRRLLALVLGAAALLAFAAPPNAGAVVPRLPRLHAVDTPGSSGRIVDAYGRQVTLRGVNVNALAGYWKGTRFRTTFPLEAKDPARMARIGWNSVRLLLSWSRVEPRPGVYSKAYLDRVAATVRRLARAGIYTIVDLHQDAWGPARAARQDEVCPSGSDPAIGWDGAPSWATLDDGLPRCFTSEREINPSTRQAWQSFFLDRAGVQARYVRMLGHVARRFARSDAVAGFDLMNEPNALGPADETRLVAMYERAIAAIRAAERAGHGHRHLVLFEPSVLFSAIGRGTLPSFAHGPDAVYAPHLYTGGFDGGAITADAFAEARKEAAGFGGVPVLSGEWGADPKRAGAKGDGYFLAHQALQDVFGFSADLWTWRESCGDPHKVGDFRAGRVPEVWGEFRVSCTDNVVRGPRAALVHELTRGWVRAAPGRLTSSTWDPKTRVLTARGTGSRRAGGLVAVLPPTDGFVNVRTRGLRGRHLATGPGGAMYFLARPRGGAWRLRLAL